jgi:hypothetical protein
MADTPPPTAPRLCPACGTVAGASDRFCEACGAALPEIPVAVAPGEPSAVPPPAAPRAPAALRARRRAVAAVAGVAVAAVAIGVFIATRGDGDGDAVTTATSSTRAITSTSSTSSTRPSSTVPQAVSGRAVVDDLVSGFPTAARSLGRRDVECVAGSLEREATAQQLRALLTDAATYDEVEILTVALDLCLAADATAPLYTAMFARSGLPQPDASCLGTSLSTRIGLGDYLRLGWYTPPPDHAVEALRAAATECGLDASPDVPVPPPPGPSPVTPPPVGEEPAGFPTPADAIAWYLEGEDLRYAGDCEGVDQTLGGTVLCSVLVEDRGSVQVHRWGVFATDQLGGWLLVGSGSAGWSVADAARGEEQPDW